MVETKMIPEQLAFTIIHSLLCHHHYIGYLASSVLFAKTVTMCSKVNDIARDS